MGTLATTPGATFTVSNDLLSQLLSEMRTEAVDNLFVKSAFLDFARKAGGVEKVEGGPVWSVPLAVAEHSNITQLSQGFENLDMNVQDVTNPATYQWCSFAAPISISRQEELQNSGEAAMVKILQTRLDNVMGMLKRESEKQIVAGTSSVLTRLNSLYGGISGTLPASTLEGFLYTDTSGTADTVGGLVRTTALGLSNIVIDDAGSSNVVDSLTRAWILANDQAIRGQTDLILAGNIAFREYKNSLYANEQYVDMKTLDGGNLALSFHGAPVVFSSWMSSAVATGSSETLDEAFYGINFDGIKLRIHPDADFATGDFYHANSQLARIAQFHCMMQLYANHLGSQFVVIGAGTS